jgi:hypothetical protein
MSRTSKLLLGVLASMMVWSLVGADELDPTKNLHVSITVEFFFFYCVFFSGRTFTFKLQVPTSTIQFLWWGYRIMFY